MSSEIGHLPDTRQGILRIAKSLGLFRMGLAAQRRVNPLLVLCYHGISEADEHEWNPELYMPPALFDQRLARLRELGFRIQALSSALEELQAGTLGAPTVALTFDDGWHDFYSQAWPILRKYSAPATVYQTTFYSNFNRPVFDVACSYLLWRGRGRVLKDRFLTGQDSAIILNSPHVLQYVERHLKERVLQLAYSAEEKDGVLQNLAEVLGLNYAELFRSRRLHLMNAAEIGEISRHGIDVQLHTHSHSVPEDKERFLREIERNRFYIEAATGKLATHFCYPNGCHRPELGPWLKEAGVLTATTCDPGFVRRSGEPMLLPRLTDSALVSSLRFESWLSGVALAGARCKRWFAFSWPKRSLLPPLEAVEPPGVESAAVEPADRETVRARAAASGH